MSGALKVGDRVALTFQSDWIGGPYQTVPGGRPAAVVRSQGVMCGRAGGQSNMRPCAAEASELRRGCNAACAAVTAWHALCAAAPLLPGNGACCCKEEGAYHFLRFSSPSYSAHASS